MITFWLLFVGKAALMGGFSAYVGLKLANKRFASRGPVFQTAVAYAVTGLLPVFLVIAGWCNLSVEHIADPASVPPLFAFRWFAALACAIGLAGAFVVRRGYLRSIIGDFPNSRPASPAGDL